LTASGAIGYALSAPSALELSAYRVVNSVVNYELTTPGTTPLPARS
jgi:hypothetical protein